MQKLIKDGDTEELEYERNLSRKVALELQGKHLFFFIGLTQ